MPPFGAIISQQQKAPWTPNMHVIHRALFCLPLVFVMFRSSKSCWRKKLTCKGEELAATKPHCLHRTHMCTWRKKLKTCIGSVFCMLLYKRKTTIEELQSLRGKERFQGKHGFKADLYAWRPELHTHWSRKWVHKRFQAEILHSNV